MTQHHEPVFACNMHAIPSEQRAEHTEHIKHVFSAIQEVEALPTGYAVRLPGENDMLQNVAAFIANERLCCPFFRFELTIEPEQGPLWLRITGESDVKPFLQNLGFLSSSGT